MFSPRLEAPFTGLVWLDEFTDRSVATATLYPSAKEWLARWPPTLPGLVLPQQVYVCKDTEFSRQNKVSRREFVREIGCLGWVFPGHGLIRDRFLVNEQW